jgi:hypothetical protein
MKTKTHFTFRVDTWTPDGESIVEHVAGIDDYKRRTPRALVADCNHRRGPRPDRERVRCAQGGASRMKIGRKKPPAR